jgi:hypothetical protein
MGYTTDFEGSVAVVPELNADEVSFLKDFAQTRRVQRTGGPLYVGHDVPGYIDDYGQGQGTDTVTDGNRPPAGQPGLWCQWVPNDDGSEIEWDGGEKFYESAAWMKYIVENLLAPSARPFILAHLSEDPRLASFTANHHVTGSIFAQGEDPSDRWVLVVTDNVVKVGNAVITYHDAQPL